MKARNKQRGVIWQVQRHLYHSLKQNQTLSDHKINIFHQIPKNTPFPYIYLGRFMVFNNSLKGIKRLQLLNEVHLYSQARPIQDILEAIEAIKLCLNQRDVALRSGHIEMINFIQMELDIMSDAKTYRVISKYKILLEEGRGR